MKKSSHAGTNLPASEQFDFGDVPAEALRGLLDSAADGMCLVDPADWSVRYANSLLLRMVSRSASPTAVNFLSWLAADGRDDGERQLTQVASGALDKATFTSRLLGEGSAEVAAEIAASRVAAAGRSLLAIVVRRASSVGSSRIGAQIDPLTGLSDRAFLMDRLTSLVEGERSRDHQCAVLFVDVDGFKQVNDVYGHLVGDRVLCEVARRLAECVRTDDHVTRFGGDEFVVLLEQVRGRGEIQPVVDRIGAAFDRPVELPQGSVTLAVSVGVAEAEPQGQTAEQLLDAADRAMYAAKRPAT